MAFLPPADSGNSAQHRQAEAEAARRIAEGIKADKELRAKAEEERRKREAALAAESRRRAESSKQV